jgi:hypothetical protein
MPGPSAIGVQAVLRRRRGSAALPEPVHGPRSKPAGWWELMGLSGTRDGVAKAVNASAIPDRYKTLLAAEIAGLGAQYNLVKLDAHYHLVNGSARLTVTVTPTSGLV